MKHRACIARPATSRFGIPHRLDQELQSRNPPAIYFGVLLCPKPRQKFLLRYPRCRSDQVRRGHPKTGAVQTVPTCLSHRPWLARPRRPWGALASRLVNSFFAAGSLGAGRGKSQGPRRRRRSMRRPPPAPGRRRCRPRAPQTQASHSRPPHQQRCCPRCVWTFVASGPQRPPTQ